MCYNTYLKCGTEDAPLLKTRVKTAAVLTVVVLAALYFSYLPFVAEACAAVLAIAATYELFGACGSDRRSLAFCLCEVFAAVLPFLPLRRFPAELGIVFPFVIVLFAVQARDLTRFALPGNSSACVFSPIISILIRSYPALIRTECGLYHVLLVLAVCVLTDTGAYFIGSRFGRHKLAPSVSPGKSVEGAVGGMLLAALIPLPLCLIVSGADLARVDLTRVLLFCLPASILAQAGDLSLSVIKRVGKIKDYGKLLPGHGGVLDRIDSSLFAMSFGVLFFARLPVFTAV